MLPRKWAQFSGVWNRNRPTGDGCIRRLASTLRRANIDCLSSFRIEGFGFEFPYAIISQSFDAPSLPFAAMPGILVGAAAHSKNKNGRSSWTNPGPPSQLAPFVARFKLPDKKTWIHAYFLEKEKFRAQVPRNMSTLRECSISEYCGKSEKRHSTTESFHKVDLASLCYSVLLKECRNHLSECTTREP